MLPTRAFEAMLTAAQAPRPPVSRALPPHAGAAPQRMGAVPTAPRVVNLVENQQPDLGHGLGPRDQDVQEGLASGDEHVARRDLGGPRRRRQLALAGEGAQPDSDGRGDGEGGMGLHAWEESTPPGGWAWACGSKCQSKGGRDASRRTRMHTRPTHLWGASPPCLMNAAACCVARTTSGTSISALRGRAPGHGGRGAAGSAAAGGLAGAPEGGSARSATA